MNNEVPRGSDTYKPSCDSDPIRVYHDEDKENLQGDGYDGPGWYFWDEMWGELHGPFGTLEECKQILNAYASNL